MVKQIVRDVFFLGQPSEPATKADIQVGKDLQDTLKAHREGCVGYAAGEPGALCGYGGKHDWCKEEYHHCKYGLHRCCDVQSGDCFKT